MQRGFPWVLSKRSSLQRVLLSPASLHSSTASTGKYLTCDKFYISGGFAGRNGRQTSVFHWRVWGGKLSWNIQTSPDKISCMLIKRFGWSTVSALARTSWPPLTPHPREVSLLFRLLHEASQNILVSFCFLSCCFWLRLDFAHRCARL